MLLNYQQFQLRQSVRSAMGLTNPVLVESENIAIPRSSVIHYLDYKSEKHFPERSLSYLSNIPPNKRIPITNIVELLTMTDTTILANRSLVKQLALWKRANAGHFKILDLKLTPNLDTQTNSVFNYQLLKGLYAYKSTSVAELSRYKNVYGTYWNNVHEALGCDQTSEHFVTIPVPSLIPSRALLNNLLNYPPATFARVVSDPDLNSVIQLYQFLKKEFRDKSTMSPITEEDSKRMTVELTYRGYSFFFKLSYLVAMSNESELESKRKIEPDMVQRIFLLMLLKMQKKVYDVQNVEAPSMDNPDGEETDTSIVNSDSTDEDKDLEQENVETVKEPVELISGFSSSVRPKANVVKIDVGLDDIELNLDNDLMSELGQMEGSTDDIFSKLMAQTTSKIKPSKLVEVGDFKKPTDTSDSIDEAEEELPEEPYFNIDYSDERKIALLKPKTNEEALEEHLTLAKTAGAINSVEVRALRKVYEQRKQLKSPFKNELIDAHKEVTLEDLDFPKEELNLSIKNNLVDEGLKTEVLFNFDRLYVNKLLDKDVLGCVTQIEAAGVIIKDYQVERNNSVLGSYDVHKLTLKPFKGRESTVYFRLPVVNNEGEFKASGITYRMRKQKSPLPLVKISPSKVSITSNYGKLFMSRTERKSFDPYTQFSDWVKKEYLGGSGTITSIYPGNCFDNTVTKPNMVMALSQEFKQFSNSNYTFIFSPEILLETVKKEDIAKAESDGKLFVVGYINSNKTLLVMDLSNQIYSLADLTTPVGDLPTLAGMDTSKLPVQFASIKVLGESMAFGPVMGYYLGLKGLLEVTGTKFEVVGPRKQPAVDKDTIVLKLLDCKLLISADTATRKLIFGGYLFYKDTLKTISLEDLDSTGVYLKIFEQRGGGLMHLRELDLLKQLFLDPITVDVLKSMKEPTDYLRVLLKACEMLDDFKHPDANDPNYYRIRGYDRIPGLMYRVLTQSVRTAKMGMSKNKIELDPYGVWNMITQDTTVKIVEDTNPITDIKETEALTFTGADGLNKSATPEKLRRYHANDIGLISEATVDSSDVALNIYLTPYAKLESLRGLVSPEKTTRKDTIFSTSVLLTPMGEFDDPKRINFSSIQNGHTIAADGYEQPILRTGYEYLMPYKVGDLYCTTAKTSGKVESLTDKKMVIVYSDGEKQTIKIGDTYGRMEGSVYKHQIVTDLKVGEKFVKSDYICYNTGFFEKDWLDPKRLIMKFNRNVTVALTMGDEVYEDSSAVSKKLGDMMSTLIVKEKSFIIEFDKNILDLKAEGAELEVDDTLFTVTDASTDYNNLSSSSVDLLKGIANLSPKAKMKGSVYKYEVKYNGDLSDMSPTLKKIVQRLDRETEEELGDGPNPVRNNRVTSEYRCAGKNLMPRTLELKVFIQYKATQAHGDKGVFAAQMKSVVSDVFRSTITTESGTEVDALFSYRSILNRTALSPLLVGTTNRLLKHISPMIADVYFNS